MKKFFLPYLVAAMSLLSLPAFSQDDKDTTALLGLPGDNLDLYAVLTLFQKSKTIEDFEKSLNEKGINNLDLDLDKKVDFIKVVTEKKGDSYSFILRVDVSKTESQDVAVILLDKDKDKKITLQIVGDEELYGKDYVVEPSPNGTPSVTANPAYVGPEPVTVNVPATTTVVVQSAPIVQYVYSPAYVPYYPPYYYGVPPAYFAARAAFVIGVGIYRHNHYHYHGGYHGGHYGGGNTVVINNRNNYNNYNNNKMRSNTVSNNMSRGNYNNNVGASNRASAGTNNRPSNGPSASTRPSTTPSNRPSAGTSNRPSGGASSSPRPSTTPSSGFSSSSRPSSSSSNFSNRSSSGGGRSMGGGGGSRGGGGGGGGRRR